MKTWKNKVCKQSENRKIRIENDYSEKEDADKFADIFKGACTPNTLQFDIEKKKDFMEKMRNYCGDSFLLNVNYNAEVIGTAVA